MHYYRNKNLKEYNSFRLKSIAKEIWFPETIEELQKLVIKLKNKKFEILGDGTNVLLKPKINRVISLISLPIKSNYITCFFIDEMIARGFGGLEGLIGLPGSIGGAIIGNAGSGKYTISDYLFAVITMDYNGDLHIYPKNSLKFGRRYSILQKKKEIIVDAIFDFKIGKIDQNKIKQVKEYRKNFPKGYSVGGIFKNWYVLCPYEKEIRAIKSPNLIISKYLNVIINNGKATFSETIDFINQIRKIVKEPLEFEVKILG